MENHSKNKPLLGKAAIGLQLGLVMLIVYLAVRAVLAYVAPESLWTLPTQNANASTAASPRAAQSYDFSFDPFHLGEVSEPIDVGEDAPETTLNLKLFGLRSGENGTAILQTPDNKQGVYAIGDEIINGVSLKSISSEFIVLSINGRLERLTFARDQKSTLRAALPKAPSSGSRAASPSASGMSVEDFMREVQIKPVVDGNDVRGYKVSPQFGGAKLSKYGLEDGDILLALGGTDLTRGYPDWSDIAKNISRAGELVAKIDRSGKITTVKVKM